MNGIGLIIVLAEITVVAWLFVSRVQLRRARAQANTDPLTGLPNRRAFEAALSREVTRANRYGNELALLALDLDNLKRLNSISHMAGDEGLCEVAAALRACVRVTDTACRVGGDEFAVVLFGADEADARRLYERVCEHLATVTVSAGVATYDGDQPVELAARADAALRRAKRGGKARVLTDPPLSAVS